MDQKGYEQTEVKGRTRADRSEGMHSRKHVKGRTRANGRAGIDTPFSIITSSDQALDVPASGNYQDLPRVLDS
jgi:hypothetical protein